MTNVHTAHCCFKHGCKYGDAHCVVVLGDCGQDWLCEECFEENRIDLIVVNPRPVLTHPIRAYADVEKIAEWIGDLAVIAKQSTATATSIAHTDIIRLSETIEFLLNQLDKRRVRSRKNV